ncbi:MAG TPA: CHAT domain-containing tetratricopeptide repeat protein [Candidatus Acidoferrum sp.]|nr:CHAT domain-containing tetratricopeptide repeat protein [Candidatus Acidoferrum sp.]
MKLKRGEVMPALEESDRALQRYPSEKTEWHWRFRLLKAEILVRQGLYNESLALTRHELPSSFATSDLAVWRKLTQGTASAFTQQLSDAERFLAEGETLAKENHPDLLGQVELRKGTARFLAGNLAEAETAYRQTLRIAREQKDSFLEASALNGLGLVATKNEHYDEAVDWNRAALSLSQSLGSHSSSARVLGNTAWSYRELGDLDSALALYKQAEEVSSRNALVEDQLYWLTGISAVYYEQHDYGSAEVVLTQALDLARGQGDKRTLAEYLNDLSEIALETGQIDTAEKYYKEATEAERAGLDQSGEPATLLVRGRIAESKHEFPCAEESFRRVVRDPKVDSAQRWEAEARLAKLYAEERLDARAEKEFRRSLETIETVRSSVQAEDLRMSFLTGAISFYDDYVDFLIAHQRVENALEVAELGRARTLAEGLGASPIALKFPLHNFHAQQIAQRMHATVLFYWLGQNHSYLWVITPTKTTYFTLPKAAEIESVVKSYRRAIPGMRDAEDAAAADGKKLYAMLVEPAKKLIPKGSRVIVLPAESLYGLNFETLVAPDPQPHFWIEDVTVTTANSLTLLASSAQRRAPEEKSLLLVGNTEPNANFPALAQAPVEIEKLEHYFPEQNRKVLEGKSATPTAYLHSSPEKFAYLHFVTHGTASITRPLESAVILSSEGDSYKLYARDIVKHRLNAHLVTISACDGLGKRTYSGEGLVGLSWAFLRAGAHNVIGALWEVSDASTPQLMDALYNGLRQGKDPATALRDAKLSLLHSNSDTVFKKPFYWAPFQLYAGS